MSQTGTKFRRNVGGRLQIYNVPPEWIELLQEEARRRGISVSDFVKVYILEPWVKRHAKEGRRYTQGDSDGEEGR